MLCAATDFRRNSIYPSKRCQVWMPHFQPDYGREELCSQVRVLLQIHATSLDVSAVQSGLPTWNDWLIRLGFFSFFLFLDIK